MKDLKLSLKRKWFEMTRSGIKTEDYREITPYWVTRLCRHLDGCKIDRYEIVEHNKSILDYVMVETTPSIFKCSIMTLGYPKSTNSDRILKLEHKGIEIRTGNPEWGADPNKLYFVIKHGNILPNDK